MVRGFVQDQQVRPCVEGCRQRNPYRLAACVRTRWWGGRRVGAGRGARRAAEGTAGPGAFRALRCAWALQRALHAGPLHRNPLRMSPPLPPSPPYAARPPRAPPDSVASGCVAMAPLMPKLPRWFLSSCSRTAGHRSCSVYRRVGRTPAVGAAPAGASHCQRDGDLHPACLATHGDTWRHMATRVRLGGLAWAI